MSFEPAPPWPIELPLRELGLSWPETHEDFPWGERALKVKGKMFGLLGTSDRGFFFTVKLPLSAAAATSQPWAKPTGYGLGRSGWISARFEEPGEVPEDLLRDWMCESYRAVAPKALVKRLAADEP